MTHGPAKGKAMQRPARSGGVEHDALVHLVDREAELGRLERDHLAGAERCGA